MNKRLLFIPLAIVLVMLGVYNLAIHFAAKKTQRQHLLGVIDHLPPSTECVFLGNSLIEAGCDAATFQSAWPQSSTSPVTVNLGLGATTPVEHYLILKHAFDQPVHIKYIIYGFFDDQLNSSSSGSWEDLIGNRAFSYYFPREAAALYAPDSRLVECRMAITEHIPMLTERSTLWDRIELLRRQLDQIGMPKQKVNRFGRVADFNALEAADVPSFTRRCQTILTGQKGLSAPIRAMVTLAHEHGAKFYFVEMPMSPRHRQTFYSLSVWTEMQNFLQTLANRQGVVYIAASNWVRDSADFEDTVHLNEQGARSFSAQLATVMARLANNSTNLNAHVAAVCDRP